MSLNCHNEGRNIEHCLSDTYELNQQICLVLEQNLATLTGYFRMYPNSIHMLEPFSVSFIGWICLQQEKARRVLGVSVIARQVIMLKGAKTLVAKVWRLLFHR
jgi:hypothetical protein